MSERTIRGSVAGTHRLWAALLGGPGLRNRVSRVNLPCRSAASRDATPAADSASKETQRHILQVQNNSGKLGQPFCPDLGYSRQLIARYDIGQRVGSGGNADVYVVQNKLTHKRFACKSIPKSAEADASPTKSAGHLQSIRREIQVLNKLKGSLSACQLVEVFEDDTHVHLVLEYCKGGELAHRIGTRHYSERTVRTTPVWAVLVLWATASCMYCRDSLSYIL